MALFSSNRRPQQHDATPPAPPHPDRFRADTAEEVLDPDAIYEPGSSPPGNGHAEEHPDGSSLARAAFTILGHTGSWAAGAYYHAGRRVVGVVIAPASGVDLARDIAAESTRVLQTVAEVTELDRRLDEAGPAGAFIKRAAQIAGELLPVNPTELARRAEATVDVAHEPTHHGRPPTLREQGEELLRRSRDVNDTEDSHPAYSRILSELSPDDARILRLMLVDGPQATVDVRTGGPLGLINSHLIAPGLSMIGARAGCRYVDRVPSYLNNLFRLGLIWFSRETLRDHQRYQVLEAQPDVLEAIHSVTAAKVVRRSVHLTPFGEDFCRVCLSDDVPDLDALPGHSAPKGVKTEPQPPNETVEGLDVAVSAAIFDIGSVLENNPRTGWNARWAERLGISSYEFGRRFGPIWQPGMTGASSAAQIEALTAAEFGLDAAGLEAMLADIWAEYLGTPNQALIDYFRALRPALRTGILSNSCSGATEREAYYGFSEMCDVLVYSHEVGLVKPDPRIYALTCQRLAVAPADAVFVDDRPENVAAAASLGMRGIRFTSNDQTIGELDQLLRTASRR